MSASSVPFSPTQHTLEEIARSALPLLQVLGLSLDERMAQDIVENEPALDAKNATARLALTSGDWFPPKVW